MSSSARLVWNSAKAKVRHFYCLRDPISDLSLTGSNTVPVTPFHDSKLSPYRRLSRPVCLSNVFGHSRRRRKHKRRWLGEILPRFWNGGSSKRRGSKSRTVENTTSPRHPWKSRADRLASSNQRGRLHRTPGAPRATLRTD
jgi:hypothetical protein